jgi:hypothetical protein
MSPNPLNIPEDYCFFSPVDIEKSMLTAISSQHAFGNHPSLLSLL